MSSLCIDVVTVIVVDIKIAENKLIHKVIMVLMAGKYTYRDAGYSDFIERQLPFLYS